jgi:hypothetical protein
MKKRAKGELGSLDSLLDTMTTVVGILIILLIVVQLDVSETVNRIITSEIGDVPQVTAEQVLAMRVQYETSVAESAEAVVKIPELRGLLASSEFELQRIDTRLKATEAQLKKSSDTEQALDELSELITMQQQTVEELEQDVEAKQEMLQNLYARVEKETPAAPGPPPKVVRLPDPQDPPANSKPVNVLCRGGRLYPVFTAKLQVEVDKAIVNSRALKNDKGELDADTVISFFRRVPVGDRWWVVEPTVVNYRLKFILHRRSTGGEELRGLRHPLSNYMKLLGSVDPAKAYLRFYVWPDSFGIYLEARGIATEKKLLAGWVPTERTDDWVSYFGTYPTMGASKDKPKPAPAPATPAKPAPKVRDVID